MVSVVLMLSGMVLPLYVMVQVMPILRLYIV